jgi:hypothetical protein
LDFEGTAVVRTTEILVRPASGKRGHGS